MCLPLEICDFFMIDHAPVKCPRSSLRYFGSNTAPAVWRILEFLGWQSGSQCCHERTLGHARASFPNVPVRALLTFM
jgi:hypothetical protein